MQNSFNHPLKGLRYIRWSLTLGNLFCSRTYKIIKRRGKKANHNDKCPIDNKEKKIERIVTKIPERKFSQPDSTLEAISSFPQSYTSP